MSSKAKHDRCLPYPRDSNDIPAMHPPHPTSVMTLGHKHACFGLHSQRPRQPMHAQQHQQQHHMQHTANLPFTPNLRHCGNIQGTGKQWARSQTRSQHNPTSDTNCLRLEPPLQLCPAVRAAPAMLRQAVHMACAGVTAIRVHSQTQRLGQPGETSQQPRSATGPAMRKPEASMQVLLVNTINKRVSSKLYSQCCRTTTSEHDNRKGSSGRK